MNAIKNTESKFAIVALGAVLMITIAFAAAPRVFADDAYYSDLGSDSYSSDLGNDSYNSYLGNDSYNSYLGNDSYNSDLGNDSYNSYLGNDNYYSNLGNDPYFSNLNDVNGGTPDGSYGGVPDGSYGGTPDGSYGGTPDGTYGGVPDGVYSTCGTSGCEMVYDSNCGCETQYIEENGVYYTEQTSAASAQQSYGQSSQPSSQSYPQQSRPFSFSAPQSYYSNPVVYQAQQQQQQQQQQIRSVAQPSNNTTTNNTCTNNSCNYTDNSNNSVTISNSGNTTTTVYPVSQSHPQYPTQYVPTQPTYNNVSCYISSSGNYLSWAASGATSAWLSGVGTVSPTGSMAINSAGGTYTLTVSGPNGSNTCNTYVSGQNYNTSVSLSQIPYTGFDFGPVGNALYWLSLLAFAAAGAYLLVYYRGGMALVASSAIARTTTSVAKAPVAFVKSTAQKIEKALAENTTLANLPVMPAALATTDAMTITRSKDGSAPRIIITRN